MTAGLKTIISLSFVRARPRIPPRNPLLRTLPPIPAPPCRPHIYSRSSPQFPRIPLFFPDDFSDSSSSGVLDLGRFATGFLCMMGVALPAVLAHSHIITVPAMFMSIIGGVLIYGTIISFGMFFQEEAEF
ncbi:vacuolar protein sorting 55 superfamily [Botrytis cinerea]